MGVPASSFYVQSNRNKIFRIRQSRTLKTRSENTGTQEKPSEWDTRVPVADLGAVVAERAPSLSCLLPRAVCLWSTKEWKNMFS